MYIILTPPFHIANDKPKRILLASVLPLTTDPVNNLRQAAQRDTDGLAGEELDAANKRKVDAQIELEKLIHNNHSPKYYFLPRSRNFDGGLINFQLLETEDPRSMAARFERLATVNNLFLKDIIAKFSFYYSRQGAPDLNFTVDDL